MTMLETAGRSGQRRTLLTVGLFLALFGAAGVAGGAFLLHHHSSKTDRAGFYASGFHPLQSPTAALVSKQLRIDDGGSGWDVPKGLLGTLRFTATGTAAKPVFLGVAHRAQVDRFLHGVRYDEVDSFDLRPFSVTTHRHPGASRAARPASHRIWTASASGAGKQSLRWNVRNGDWAFVVMNADGSPGLSTHLSVGATIGLILWLGVGLAALGTILLLSAAIAIAAGARGSRRRVEAITAAEAVS